jgi:long-chain fatty acid transport protein
MTNLDGVQLSFSGVGVHVRTTYKDGSIGGAPAFGESTLDDFIPSVYLTSKINERWALGFGVFEPFGNKADFSTKTSANTQRILHSGSFYTTDFGPSVAFKVTDQLSIGAGAYAEYFKISSDVSTTLLVGPPPVPTNLTDVSLTADDYRAVFNAGVLYQFNDAFRMGLSYRSRVSHHASGSSIAPAATPSGEAFSDNTKVDFDMPPIYILSAYYDTHCNWEHFATVQFEQWDIFNEIQISGLAGSQPDQISPQFYNNAWRFALGTAYTVSPRVKLRTGVAYSTQAVNDDFRSISLPEENNVDVGVGVTIAVSRSTNLDFGYNHLFSKSADINTTANGFIPPLAATGKGQTHSDLLGIQISMKFD